MNAGDRPFTLAGVPAVERRTADQISALVSVLQEAAGTSWAGAALAGAPAWGEGATAADAEGAFILSDRLELFAVLEVPASRVRAFESRLRSAALATARARHATVAVRCVARTALAFLPPTLECLELLGASRVVDGPGDLFAAASLPAAAPLPLFEALRLLVRAGAGLLAAERELNRAGRATAPASASLALRSVDLALGSALLASAGRWRPGEAARAAALRELAAASAEVGVPPPGLKARMSWTLFRDVVDGHRQALKARSFVELPAPLAETRMRAARATDRWMEVLRLFEEERLGEPLGDWSGYARILGTRHRDGRSRSLFPALLSEPEGGLPPRRVLRSWPSAERLAPALAALLDWDPRDLPLAPLLLDLPDDATREALASRASALAASA